MNFFYLRKRKSVAALKARQLREENERFKNSGELPKMVPVRLQVLGYPVGSSTLGVTRAFNSALKWVITERATGCVVCGTEFRRVEDAYKAALEIASFPVDWSRMKSNDGKHNLEVLGEHKDALMALFNQINVRESQSAVNEED
jgi:hypothetical protein